MLSCEIIDFIFFSQLVLFTNSLQKKSTSFTIQKNLVKSKNLSIYLYIFLSIYLFICLSFYLSIYLSVYLSIYLSIYLPQLIQLSLVGQTFQVSSASSLILILPRHVFTFATSLPPALAPPTHLYDVRYFSKGFFQSGNFPRVFSQMCN